MTDADGLFSVDVDLGVPGASWQQVKVSVFGSITGAGFQGTDAVAQEDVILSVPPGVSTPGYDLDGNLNTDGQWDYLWNARNQLASMTRSQAWLDAGHKPETLTFEYDAEGRRIYKSYTRWDEVDGVIEVDREHCFVWEDWNLLAEEISEGTEVWMRYYTWGLDVSNTRLGAGGVGGLLGIRDGKLGRTLLPIYDARGNVIAVVDGQTRETLAEWDFGPFGEPLLAKGDPEVLAACAFGFATKYTDPETGLAYFGHRYLDPMTGRWLSREPLGEGESKNLYAYCHNDPISKLDYIGLEPWAFIDGRLVKDGIPCQVCHGRTGPYRETVPGFTPFQSVVGGVHYDSVSNGHIQGNTLAGLGGGIAALPQDLGNVAANLWVAALEPYWEWQDYTNADATRTGVRSFIYPNVDHDSMITGSGQASADILLSFVGVGEIKHLGTIARVSLAEGKTISQARVIAAIHREMQAFDFFEYSRSFNSSIGLRILPEPAYVVEPGLFPAPRWGVDPTTRAADEAAGVLVNGRYIKNPTAQNLGGMLTESGKIGSKQMSGRFMYVVDDAGQIVIGTRAGQRMPHPTLIGGANPQVRGAGIVDIRGGRIYSVDNVSGHFKPGAGSLQAAEEAFGQLPSSAFHRNFQGYLPFE